MVPCHHHQPAPAQVVSHSSCHQRHNSLICFLPVIRSMFFSDIINIVITLTNLIILRVNNDTWTQYDDMSTCVWVSVYLYCLISHRILYHCHCCCQTSLDTVPWNCSSHVTIQTGSWAEILENWDNICFIIHLTRCTSCYDSEHTFPALLTISFNPLAGESTKNHHNLPVS